MKKRNISIIIVLVLLVALASSIFAYAVNLKTPNSSDIESRQNNDFKFDMFDMMDDFNGNEDLNTSFDNNENTSFDKMIEIMRDNNFNAVSYTHLRAHETRNEIV